MFNYCRALMVILAASVSLCLSHGTAEDTTMIFESSDGTGQIITGLNIEMRFSDNYLIADNGLNTIEIPLSMLTRFYFSDYNTGVVGTIGNDVTDFEVTTLSGVPSGRFESIDAMRESLPEGIYIIRVGGNTYKLLIK